MSLPNSKTYVEMNLNPYLKSQIANLISTANLIVGAKNSQISKFHYFTETYPLFRTFKSISVIKIVCNSGVMLSLSLRHEIRCPHNLCYQYIEELLLFLLYVNDLTDIFTDAVTDKLYADDVKTYSSVIVNEKVIGQELQQNLNKLTKWASHWQLTDFII